MTSLLVLGVSLAWWVVLYFVIKTAVRRRIDASVTAMKVSDVRGFLEARPATEASLRDSEP
jgi:hypothetical protein